RGGANRFRRRHRCHRVAGARRGLPGLALDPPLGPGFGPRAGPFTARPAGSGGSGAHPGTSKGSVTMRTAYRVLAYLLALSVAVQVSLIAFGAFALENDIDNGPVADGDTTGVTLHHFFAYVVLLFAVALLAVSFGAKVERDVRWAAIALVLIVVQFFLAYAA